MKIVQLIDSLSPGGAERFVVDLCNQLAETNEVYLLTFRNHGEKTDFYRDQLSDKVKQISYYGKINAIGKIWQMFVVLWYMLRIRPEIIHTHTIAFNYAILPYLLIPRVKVFYTVHNIAEKDTEMGIVANIRKKMMKNNFRAITISPYCEKTFVDYYGYRPFATIENGCRPLSFSNSLVKVKCEINKMKHSENSKVFICVARFMPQKNHELLFESFSKLHEQNVDFELLLIGQCANESQMNYLKSLDKTEGRIHILGVKKNVTDYLFNSDYFVLSSRWEGLPISILEAGFSGCYPISTPVGGVPDVLIDPSWGTLSHSLTVGDYLSAIHSALNISIDRKRIQDLYKSKYSMNVCAKKYIDVFVK